MKKAVIVWVVILITTNCRHAVEARKESQVLEDSTDLPTVSAELVEDNFQKEEIWNCKDAGMAVFQAFTPDTLIMDLDYIPFDIHTSYKLNDLKLLFGNYRASDKGEYSPYDSETNFGQRLLCFNSNNQMVFQSHGQLDSWLFNPYFYIADDKKQIVVLCQEGAEYFWGANVFLIEKNITYDLGFLNVEPYSEDEYSALPIASVTNIKRIDNTLVFSFDVDTLISFDKDEEGTVTNIEYVYKAGKLTKKSLTN